MAQVTELLRRFNRGEPDVLNDLLPEVYQDLRRLAQSKRAGERAEHTLTATALVHETYLRLLKQRRLDARDRLEFLGVAAVTMRRILVDHARARSRHKRGGGAPVVPLDEVEDMLSEEDSDELIALDEALRKLDARDPRAAKVVQMRCFGGLQVQEIAEILAVNVRTVRRDWQAARAWLRVQVADSLRSPLPP